MFMRMRMIGIAAAALLLTGACAVALAAVQSGNAAGSAALGTPPPNASWPVAQFAFEFRVTLSPAVVVGETAFGRRQYIPITGGAIAGPKLTGEVIPGGWDYQLGLAGGCGTLSADYFIRASDGTVIHILNESFSCGGDGASAERSFFRPRFEAPKGPHEWLGRATFVATLELERPQGVGPAGAPPALNAIRIKFYQIK